MIGGSKFDLWFLRSIHFWLINFWRLGEYWFFGWWYWKHPNFQLVIVKNLILSCPEKDGKMTNRDPWKIQRQRQCYWLSDLVTWDCDTVDRSWPMRNSKYEIPVINNQRIFLDSLRSFCNVSPIVPPTSLVLVMAADSPIPPLRFFIGLFSSQFGG